MRTTTRRKHRTRILLALALGAVAVLGLASTAHAESRAKRGATCRTAGTVRDAFVCSTGRDGVLRWRPNAKPPATRPGATRGQTGVVVVDGLPFARRLEPGLSAREVAFRFAKDWTALMACLDWGPDEHNATGKNEIGAVTSVCNNSVWGTPNAFIDWYVHGRLSNEAYYGPVAALWDKYESYGALLRHTECPEAWRTSIVCTGYPRGYPGWYDGRTFTHHVFYKNMRLTYAGETWHVASISGPDSLEFVRGVLDPSDPAYDRRAAAQFSDTPTDAAYWEYPGCRLLGRATWDASRSTCEVYWAYRDLSGKP